MVKTICYWKFRLIYNLIHVLGPIRGPVEPLLLSDLIQQMTNWWQFVLFFPIKQVLAFHEIVSTEDNLHGMLNPVETICMKCQSLFSGQKKKKQQKKKKKKRQQKTKKQQHQNVTGICWKFYTDYLALKRLIVETSGFSVKILAFTK